MGLDWQRFLIAVSSGGNLAGCGQIKQHGAEIRELASIVVTPEFRGKGVARLVIEQLLAETEMPIYLMCRSKLGIFYERFGFQPLAVKEMPAYFRRISTLANVFSAMTKDGEGLLVMKRD